MANYFTIQLFTMSNKRRKTVKVKPHKRRPPSPRKKKKC